MDAVKAPFDWNDLFMHLDEELTDPEVSFILRPRPPVQGRGQLDPRILLVSSLRRSPYRVALDRILLSAYRLDEMSRSVGMDVTSYLRVFGLVGYTKWRTLRLNPRVREVDLLHSEHSGCIFETPASIQEYLCLISRPNICDSCYDYYRFMGCELALAELSECFRSMRWRRSWDVPAWPPSPPEDELESDGTGF